MARLSKDFVKHETVYKKTSQTKRKRSAKFASMNKHKKRSWKAYNGQGK